MIRFLPPPGTYFLRQGASRAASGARRRRPAVPSCPTHRTHTGAGVDASVTADATAAGSSGRRPRGQQVAQQAPIRRRGRGRTRRTTGPPAFSAGPHGGAHEGGRVVSVMLRASWSTGFNPYLGRAAMALERSVLANMVVFCHVLSCSVLSFFFVGGRPASSSATLTAPPFPSPPSLAAHEPPLNGATATLRHRYHFRQCTRRHPHP